MKPVGVPGGFCADVFAAPEVEPVDAVGAVVAWGDVFGGAADGEVEPCVEADVVGVLDAVASLVPVTPALRGDDEL